MRVFLAILVVVVAAAAVDQTALRLKAKEFVDANSLDTLTEKFVSLQKETFAKFGAVTRKANQIALNAASETEAAAADRKLLLTECSEVLDEDGNAISYVDIIPDACTDCGYFAAAGVTIPALTCPTSPATTTDLPVGSCCNDDSNCATGLVCDLLNAVCTNACESSVDCEAGSWFGYSDCKNTALVDEDADDSSEVLADECSFCVHAFECSAMASFCVICTDYVGPVDEELVTDAGCLYAAGEDDTLSESELDVFCTEECAYDCVVEMAESTETLFTCLDWECGVQDVSTSELKQSMRLSCAKNEDDEYCVIVIEDDFSAACDDCCAYTYFGIFASLFCEEYVQETCDSALGAGFTTTPTAVVAVLSAVFAAVFARL